MTTEDLGGAGRGMAPTADVRIAYVVLAHADPRLFGRLMHRLSHPHAAAFVHLDKEPRWRRLQRKWKASATSTSYPTAFTSNGRVSAKLNRR